jgi:hypothetical protein
MGAGWIGFEGFQVLAENVTPERSTPARSAALSFVPEHIPQMWIAKVNMASRSRHCAESASEVR